MKKVKLLKMKNKGFELSNRYLKILLIIGGFLVLTYVIYVQIFRTTRMDSKDDSLIYVLNEEYQGIVSYKEYDKSNHNNPTLYFKDSTEVTINDEFWSIIKKEDSVIKKKGEAIISVYRNNVKFTLDNKDIINSLKGRPK